MKTLYDSLQNINEGIFDIDAVDQLDREISAKCIEELFTGKYKLTKDKVGGFKAKGTMILKKCNDEEILPGICITTLDGDMYIEDCPNIKSIGNLFGELRYDDVSLGRITGTLSISNCKNFDTLQGIPASTDKLILTDLPKLKSIEYIPKWATAIMITKCGKKWSKDQIAAKAGFAKIMCSQEELDTLITEAMSEPILLRTHKYLIDNKIAFDSWPQLVGAYVEIDKIRPSQVTHYHLPADAKDCKKAINLMQRDFTGFAIGYKEDDLVFIANCRRYINVVKSVGGGKELSSSGRGYKPTEFVQIIMDPDYYSPIYGVTDIYVYDVTSTRNGGLIQRDREDARRGMINPKDYEKIARENRDRYKKAAAQMRAIRASGEYIQFAKQVEDRITSYSKMISNLIKNPEKYDVTYFGILTEHINKMTSAFANFVRFYKRLVLGDADNYDRSSVKSEMERCKEIFTEVDRYMSKV